ncbi:hypothetical protein JY651_30665 [Pyxidicoccus parkwayensis]|uniref:Lipoprotein n=1 Tax=Pyxidicoccus parkwayensis TaxID=2813578 RepID=A0ABX7NQ11_9BACT|nr:hypothetical protein [Pyxidicoccus parkwaysis]QSQ19660.1 hypothetical protein JY651_30665 [Pyxidicoccus parkwaysis]
MKRSLTGLVVALSLVACKEEPRGQLEPIPRPPGMKDTAPSAEAKAPAAPAKPAVDASKALLRWKLAAGTPTAYRLTLERTGHAPVADEPAPQEKPARGGRKGRGKEKAEAPAAAPAPTASAFPSALTFVLERTASGDDRLRVIPEGKGATADEASISERGFVLEGLQGITRNAATLVLELPRDAVGKGDTWSLGTELMTPDALGAFFQGQPPERRNEVKLVGLEPGDGGEQVATVEYDIFESRSGKIRNVRKPPTVPARAVEEESESGAPSQADVSAEVTIKGRGEFLVKAGRWRSWEGTLSTVTKGPFPPPALQVPQGNYALRLTALESAPAPQQPTARPQQ